MLIEDEVPPKRRRVEALPLDPLGIEELRDYIAELRTEIERAEAAISRKQNHRASVDSLFRFDKT